ncbi:PEP-CTERM protein-sorting domain-containing protein [Duganella sp. CF402]|uniref:PEP-CTERM sorting domain-containing protein n=1 Tax=unclassified Duganella TaxID=2636909 RepID=UPI0008C0A56E|nr:MULTISPECIES: PEP-CTERM sorting domain-containing protein [unclassified Duganella]RZT10599.1 putative secreted protein with PEP-CTERM sorting signal [Duganella sp. BK701]SEL06617.1 PEP-CTERM protein-sorting domain-containing protein [Duganella sp. CF402]
MNKFLRAPLALAIAAGLMSTAQATNYVSVEGAGVTFYYDADFWGQDSASVTGNSISFDLDPSYSLTAKVASNKPSGTSVQTYAENASAAVVAVAHNGWALSSAVGFNLQGSYSGINGGSKLNASGSGDLYAGSFSGGSFSAGSYLNSYGVEFSRNGGTPASGSVNEAQTIFNDGVKYSALGLDAFLYTNAYQGGPGTVSLNTTSARYDFSVSAVPEPTTYGMLLVGLGVMAGVARRKRQA